MEKTIILDKPLCLSIGDFKVKVLNNSVDGETFYLPVSAELFIENNDVPLNELDITYTIQLEDSFVEPNETPVARFDKGPFPYQVYRVNADSYLWVRKNRCNEVLFVYRISKNWSTWRLVVDKSTSLGTDSFSELVYIFAYSILNKGGILFHGIVMEWQERGFLFCAHSGVGKTTHTRMWRDSENAQILNGDRALCCKENNRWYTYGAPWCGSSDEYKNSKVPLTAIIILEQSDSNEVTFLSPFQGAMELIQLAFAPSWEEERMNCALNTIDDIVQRVQVLKLKCRPDLEAVDVLKAELQKIVDVDIKTNNQKNSETSSKTRNETSG